MFPAAELYYECMEQKPLIDTFCTLQKKLHKAAMGILHDEMDAEDAVQDSFCNLWTREPPATTDEARFRLFAVLKNICLNKIKRRRLTNLDNVDTAIDQPTELEAELRRIYLLKLLSPTQRKIFELAAYEEMEYEEIAQRLGVSIESVRVNMYRARKTLRDHYKNYEL